MKDQCKYCASPKILHHYKTMQCPLGGIESPPGKAQQWSDNQFEAEESKEVLLKDLTLRDIFAAFALVGLLSNKDHGDITLERTAYDLADCMLLARKENCL